MKEIEFIRSLDDDEMAVYISGVLAAFAKGLLEGIQQVDDKGLAKEITPDVKELLHREHREVVDENGFPNIPNA